MGGGQRGGRHTRGVCPLGCQRLPWKRLLSPQPEPLSLLLLLFLLGVQFSGLIINQRTTLQEFVVAGGRRQRDPPVTPRDPARPRSAMLFNHRCRSAAAPHDVGVPAGVRRLKRRDSLQERQGLDLGCVLHVSAAAAAA